MADSSGRPLKRQRKAPNVIQQEPQVQPQPQNPPQPPLPQPVDHIFIADGLLNKKPGGKKAPLSCCECRRLKLKCDRNFPCASCKKRGCAEICPDGVLVSGRGTRFILANTEQLHGKIQEMSDRIRQLEDVVQRTDPSSPLLSPEFLTIKSTMGLYSTNGGPSNNSEKEEGKKPMGAPEDTKMDVNSNGDDVMQVDRPSTSSQTGRVTTIDLRSITLDIERLNFSFPFSNKLESDPERNLVMREHIRSQLPSREEAERLWNRARHNALWQYNPHPSATFFPNLLHHIYSPTSDHQPKSITEIDPRRLALLLMILAVACIVDVPPSSFRKNSPPPHSPNQYQSQSQITNELHKTHLEAEARASRYHSLGRASLCEVPVMEETNVETVLALFYEVWFLAVWSDGKKAVGEAWGIMGLVAKLAQSIGLHRNGGKSKVIPEEVEKRRALFWELLYLDARLSLSLGRPPSLNINHMDCPRPSYIPDDDCDPSESTHHYQEWKHSCYLQCLVPVLDAISKPSLEYKAILDLDRKIREFSIPVPLRNKDTATSRSLVLQRASLSTALEAVLLQLHRTYFIRALSGPEEAFNRRHKYAPSVVAVFLSASRMIATVQELYQREPELTARILWYWSNAFSAAIALCLLVSRAPFTCLSPAALQELARARILFTEAKKACPRALQVVPILETMIDKANDIYNRWANGQELPTIVLRHITDDSLDEYDTNTNNGNNNNNGCNNNNRQSPVVQPEDPFLYTHQSLAQCIAEVHKIAKMLFPLRKPCSCNQRHQPGSGSGSGVRSGVGGGGGENEVGIGKRGIQNGSGSGSGNGNNNNNNPMMTQECPPSHEWSPPPIVNHATSPVLPEVPIGIGLLGNQSGSGSGMNVGYGSYSSSSSQGTGNTHGNGNGRRRRYSALQGSGMSPSPTPSIKSNYGHSSSTITTTTTFGHDHSNANGSVGVGVGYNSVYSNGGNSNANPSANGNGNGTGLYSTGNLIAVLPASAPPILLPPSSSKLSVDTINFELGALSSNSDQSLMMFY